MEGQPKSMARKRERHYNETKTIVAVALILMAVCIFFCLLILFPQKYLIDIFNSRLSYQLVIDNEDYFTCSNDYINFVIDKPSSDFSMYTIFIFNVSNAKDVFERGHKPLVEETGPFGFVKNTYKYEIFFDPIDSNTVSFKEYTLLTDVESEDDCEAMYFRMGRDTLVTDACSGDSCKCKSLESVINIVNPLFLKLVWEDSPFDMLSYYAMDVFGEVKRVLDEPFTEAVKGHLASYAFKEVYLFRVQMQMGYLLQASVDSLLETYSLQQIADTQISPSTCGLSSYGISTCPFTPYGSLNKYKTSKLLNSTDYPSIITLFNATSNISFLNMEEGLPKWLGLAWYYGNIDFNSLSGYTMVTTDEMADLAAAVASQLASEYFKSGAPTEKQVLGASLMVQAVAYFLSFNFLTPFSVSKTNLQALAYKEFLNTSESVPCSPLLVRCVWQWGHMRELGSDYELSNDLVFSLIDVGSAVSTNPNNLYKDINAPLWYNTFLYCNDVYGNETLEVSCTNYGYTFDDGIITRPAGLWGAATGVSTVDLVALKTQFLQQSNETQLQYFYLGCNVSSLLQKEYRSQTGFHDEYVVRFLNKYKDPDFFHDFTVGNWTELGLAQWGGGFVTYALEGVRTTNQLIRNGMWRIGADNYYDNFLEYSSWAVRQGYPQAFLYSVEDSRILLDLLARRDSAGQQFRRHIFYVGSTFIGDGVNYENRVGDVGEITFTTEANRGVFNCSGENEYACSLLSVFYTSSFAYCRQVEDLYDACLYYAVFDKNLWIASDNCKNFETSITSSTIGIQCDANGIFGHAHPYVKSRGNIFFQMVYGLAIELNVLEGLWCSSASGCDFKWGGMFTTTRVRQLLFEGYTEPSVLYYLSMKHENDGIGFECFSNFTDHCGNPSYKCNDAGVRMTLPHGQQKLLLYGVTPNDEYFAPYFLVDQKDGSMLWPYAIDNETAVYAQSVLSDAEANVTRVTNPMWAVYPAWNSNDTAFNKFYQCQKRLYSGLPGNFGSCVDTLQTGRDQLNNTLNIVEIHGNQSISPITPYVQSLDVNGSTVSNQFAMSLWEGFHRYPYGYLTRSAGLDFYKMQKPVLFNKQNSMYMELSQDSLDFLFQRDIPVTIPFATGGIPQETPKMTQFKTRRFVEDSTTWNNLRNLGVPNDSYGMPYRIPIGYTALLKYTNFPVFIETPHSYGNLKWGGVEYDFVTGTVQNLDTQRTFVDYDPITGRALRSATRQQITMRIEANAIFPNVFSSQSSCSPPSKVYALSSGYGCFCYIPLLWYEDARTVQTKEFFKMYDHFYTRPDRARVVGLVGLVVSIFFGLVGACLYISESYHKRRFHARVYID